VIAISELDPPAGDSIRLTEDDSPDGLHHTFPADLVASVDTKVHLSKPCDEIQGLWQAE